VSLTIRAAAAGDEQLLAALNAVVHELHRSRRPDRFKSTSTEEVAAWFGSLLKRPTTSMWIAEQDGVPVGYLLALVHERAANPFSAARRWCEIDQIAVDEVWRRQGIARALVERALLELRSRGIRAVEVSTWAFNEAAQRAFQHLGFNPEVIRFGLTLAE
jgi:GNAT superfamily N-acetyltransferase